MDTSLAAENDEVGPPAPPTAPAIEPANDSHDEVAALRAKGPAGLEVALARFEAADGDERAELAELVDRVAGQRYATYSRLFWYTDRERALEAARESGKPVLSLRMLGRLDEDYSCANSRFFRIALYANEKVSAYLRDNFVLHWSSERNAPKITVDYGDGRVMHRTIAGNSAHYVLDFTGRPVDVLPGLFGPEAFMTELETSRSLAIEAAALSVKELSARLAAHHKARGAAVQQMWSDVGAMIRVPSQWTADSTLQTAEMLTMSKMLIEVPMASRVQLGTQMSSVQWDKLMRERLVEAAKVTVKLDDSSRRLLASLRPSDWQSEPGDLDEAGLDALVVAFEKNIAADTMINQLTLRWQIHAHLQRPDAPRAFAAVNEWVYATLFRTPASDPWLGMSAVGAVTGLPSDGIVSESALVDDELIGHLHD